MSFWLDRWCGQISLRAWVPLIYNAVVFKNQRVRDYYSSNGSLWHKILQRPTSGPPPDQESILQLKDLLYTITLTDNGDEAIWSWSNSDLFSVKSMYNFLQERGVKERRFAQLWSVKAPLKVKIFGWLVLLQKVLSKDNLVKRGWSGKISCVLCQDEPETIDHLFLNCYFSRTLWKCLLPSKQCLDTCATVGALWKLCSVKQGVGGRKEAATVVATWWITWLE